MIYTSNNKTHTGGLPQASLSFPTQPEYKQKKSRKPGLNVLTRENIIEVSLKVQTCGLQSESRLGSQLECFYFAHICWRCSRIVVCVPTLERSQPRGKCGRWDVNSQQNPEVPDEDEWAAAVNEKSAFCKEWLSLFLLRDWKCLMCQTASYDFMPSTSINIIKHTSKYFFPKKSK